MKKINIGYIVLNLNYGGLEKVISQLILNIDHSKFNCIVFCLDSGGININDIRDAGIKYSILNRKPIKFDLKLIYKLVKLLLIEKIDVIHSNSGCAFYSALASLFTLIPAIYTDHGRPTLNEKKTRLLEDKLSSKVFKYYVSVSGTLTEYLYKDLKINNKKLITIYNGVDSHTFCKKSAKNLKVNNKTDQIILGFIGRFDPIKNLVFLLICIKQVIIEGFTNLKLVLVGDGEEMGKLKEFTSNNNLKEYIEFTGYQNDTQKYLNEFDLFILPSLSEGLSISILEAMSFSLPIIASNVGDNPVLVRDGENGYLCDSNDEECFIKKIIMLLSNKENRIKMGERSRQIIENEFSLDKMIDKYSQLYKHIIKN